MWSRVDKQAFPRERPLSDEESGVFNILFMSVNQRSPSRSIGRAFAGSVKEGDEPLFFLLSLTIIAPSNSCMRIGLAQKADPK